MEARLLPRVLIVHPPVSVAKDFIDYPYHSDLGAVQLASVLESSADVSLVDAFSLPASSLTWRPDGRAHLGAPVSDVLGAIASSAHPERSGAERSEGPRSRRSGGAGTNGPSTTAGQEPPAYAQDERLLRNAWDFVVVAYTPFHRPPNADDLLTELLNGLRATTTAPIILADLYQSGQHYVESDEAVLRAYPMVDAWVKYEGEITIPKLIAAGARPKGVIKGEAPQKLDELPFPAWNKVDLHAYGQFHARVVANLGRGDWPFPIDGLTIPMVTSRGCPFVCVHCSSNPGREPGEPKTQRRYSGEKLRTYLKTLARTHGATRVEVLDELINVNERHFDTFLDEVSILGLQFDCPNGMRADYLEREHLRKMRGLVHMVSVSAESGVQSVVDRIVKKKLDLKCIVQAAENAHLEGVPLMIHFIIGLPGETAQEINGTLSFAMDLWDRFQAWPAVQFATPLPGTQLAEGRSLPVVKDWGPHFQMEPWQFEAGVEVPSPAPAALPSPSEGEGGASLRSPWATKPPSPSEGEGRASPRARGEGTLPQLPLAASVDQATLQKFKWTFENRIHHSRGPKKVIMNVTYLCNNHCTFCAVGTRTQVHGHPPRQREILEHFRKQGVEMVDFDGGEPTLNPELVTLVRWSKHIGYKRINVTTNGRLASYPDNAKKLVQSGLTTLLFSVHGPDAQTHAGQVGVAEAFDETVAGIKNCLEFAPPGVELGMNITITKGNYQKLDAVAQLAWDLGLKWLNIQFLTPFGRATSWVAPDTQVAADIAAAVIDKWRDRMKFQVINLPFCFMPRHQEFMMGDLLKLERHMIFVNNEDVNLAEYLAERRVRKPVCESCPHAVFCGGFYELEKAPEPPWLIAEGETVRPMQVVKSTVKLGIPARSSPTRTEGQEL